MLARWRWSREKRVTRRDEKRREERREGRRRRRSRRRNGGYLRGVDQRGAVDEGEEDAPNAPMASSLSAS